jgi:hypothetical protein
MDVDFWKVIAVASVVLVVFPSSSAVKSISFAGRVVSILY